jgi:hypothetical protein
MELFAPTLGLLSGHMGHSPPHVKYSIEFVHMLSLLQVHTRDKRVSFEIVSLFTRMPINETMDMLGHHFEEDVGFAT